MKYSELSERADLVLDVKQIARWAGCLGGETTIVPLDDARHDVFLSLPEPRKHSYAVLGDWLDRHPQVTGAASGPASAAQSAPACRRETRELAEQSIA